MYIPMKITMLLLNPIFFKFLYSKTFPNKVVDMFQDKSIPNCQQLQVIHVLLEKNRGASVALSSTY
jgi:hypothetical protein